MASDRNPVKSPENRDENREIDPVVVELVRSGVMAVTENMKTNLTRTAYNIIIYEALDFTVGLFTAEGETISIGLGLPMFIRGMAATLKAKLEHFGPDGIEPGDILVTNDAYITGSHLNHITLSLPIFHDGEIVAFACCMAHWLDIGGALGGLTTDIYSEGLQVPILKLHKAGEVNQDLLEIIKMNVHIPDRAMGDLRAQVTAVKTGETGFTELLDRYGKDAVLDAIGNIMDQSEAAARARTLTIPDGVYEAESFMDDDGLDIGKRIPIRVKVTVAGDEMTVDLSNVSDQVRGFYNSGITTGYGCAQVAYKCLTSPTDYPVNDGSLRPLHVIIPPGRVVSAVKPAPMRVWMTIPMTVIDTIFKALAPVIPDRVIAGHHADLGMAMFHGIDRKEKKLFLGSSGPLGGGWGAKRDEDGMSATVCLNDGDTHNTPIELTENRFPMLIRNHSLLPDSCGPGRNRGGLGIEYTCEALSDFNLTTRGERAHCRPWGLEGGMEAHGNEVGIELDGKWEEDLPNAKVFAVNLKPGDAYRMRSGGGGGFGNPWERPVETVVNDVRQGYVSVEAASSYYGVVIDEETMQADSAATEKARAALSSGGA